MKIIGQTKRKKEDTTKEGHHQRERTPFFFFAFLSKRFLTEMGKRPIALAKQKNDSVPKKKKANPPQNQQTKLTPKQTKTTPKQKQRNVKGHKTKPAARPQGGLVMTLNSDDEETNFFEEEEEEEDFPSKASSLKKKVEPQMEFFDDLISPASKFKGWDVSSAQKSLKPQTTFTSTEDKVQRAIASRSRSIDSEEEEEDDEEDEEGEEDEEEEDEEEEEEDVEDDEEETEVSFDSNLLGKEEEKEEEEDEEDDEDDEDDEDEEDEDEEDEVKEEDILKPMRGGRTKYTVRDEVLDSSDDEDDRELQEKKKKFFSFPEQETASDLGFADLNLSRPLLKAVARLGFHAPTPIQMKCIPHALTGRDVCGSAVTGSGKTAAFGLPILERLLYRDRRLPSTRVVILTPTRELAVQCHSMLTKLAQFTDITLSLVVGGLSVQSQTVELRRQPDVVIATPGRLIDHIFNTQAVGIDAVDVLVMDEADRLLDMGFYEEVEQVIKACPKTRQTMLFSATMTEAVDKLIKLSLKHPIRISVDKKFEVATGLQQEFVRLRPKREGDREAVVAALCTRTFKSNTIIFCASKRSAHRLRLVLSLAGLKVGELHGNLSQTQRLEAIEGFQKGEINFLVCTDLAGRGLDIPSVRVVINFHMPRKLKAYVHRVGRTARAGAGGCSVSLITESDRPLLKQVIKKSRVEGALVPKHRIVPAEAIKLWNQRIEVFQGQIKQIEAEEREEREIRIAEREANRSINCLVHKDEIAARPAHKNAAKKWFQTKKEKEESKKASASAALGESDETQTKISEKRKREKEKKQKEKAKMKEEPMAMAGAHVAKKKNKLKRLRGDGMSHGPITGFEDYERTQEKIKMDRQKDHLDFQQKQKEQFHQKRLAKDEEEDGGQKRKRNSSQGNKFKSRKRYKRR